MSTPNLSNWGGGGGEGGSRKKETNVNRDKEEKEIMKKLEWDVVIVIIRER